MKERACVNLDQLFLYGKKGIYSSSAYSIYITFERPKKKTMLCRDICVFEDRLFSIDVEPNTDVYMLVYSKKGSKYHLEKLEFDDNELTMLSPVLDRLGVNRMNIDEEGWEEWLEYIEENDEYILV